MKQVVSIAFATFIHKCASYHIQRNGNHALNLSSKSELKNQNLLWEIKTLSFLTKTVVVLGSVARFLYVIKKYLKKAWDKFINTSLGSRASSRTKVNRYFSRTGFISNFNCIYYYLCKSLYRYLITSLAFFHNSMLNRRNKLYRYYFQRLCSRNNVCICI